MQPDEKVNILIVDDDPRNLLALEAILENFGQNLVKAHSGQEALRCLLKDDFALILLDVRLPDMDGFETAKLIRASDRFRHTPIIFITAYSRSKADISIGYSLGAVDYLCKPIVPEILKARVAVIVDLFKNKQQEQSKQQEKEFESLGQLGQSSNVTARLFGVATLQENAPDAFFELVRRYGDLLDRSLEQQTYRVEHNVSEEIGAMADQLGFLKAGPRDVVEIHSTALKEKQKKATPQKAKAYMEEGRLRILELMGCLVSYYRAYAIER